MASKHHNPERRSWKGRSHKRGGKLVTDLREKNQMETDNTQENWFFNVGHESMIDSTDWEIVGSFTDPIEAFKAYLELDKKVRPVRRAYILDPLRRNALLTCEHAYMHRIDPLVNED